jgi:hypothetical protein
VEAVLARTGDEADELPSGRGILLMRRFMDEVRFEEGGRKLILVMEQESGRERRRQPRQALQVPLRVAPVRGDGSIDWEAAYAAVAHNLTAEGIGLIQNQLAQTDRILIGLHTGERPVYIPAEVRHWRALGGDMVELGCRFTTTDTLGADESDTPPEVATAIDRLLDNAPPWREDERRTYPRVLFTERLEIHIADRPPLVGYARDLSKGGIAFLTTAPLPREVTLVFAATAAEPPLQVRTEIIRCAKVQEGFYDVGGRFRGLVPTHRPSEHTP